MCSRRDADMRTSQRLPLPAKPTAEAQSDLVFSSAAQPNAARTRPTAAARHEELGGAARGGRRRRGAAQGGGAGVARALGQPAAVAGVGDRRRRQRRGRRRRVAAPTVPVQAGGHGRGGSSAPREAARDFARSLWDTYELVSVARKLESGLVIADHAAAAPTVPRGGGARGAGKRAKESGRSLRSLFLRSTSRRFGEPNS